MLKIKTKNNLILVTFFIFFLILGSNLIHAQDNQVEINIEDLETPTELGDLINNYKHLSYSVVIIQAGYKVEDSLIEYQYQGEEEIQGENTYVLKFSMLSEKRVFSSMKIWYDDEIRQMKVDGKIIPKEMGGMMTEGLVNTVMFPFYNISDYSIETLKQFGDTSWCKETLANQEVDVLKIEVENMPKYDLENTEIRLAKFEDIMKVVYYDFSSPEEDKNIVFDIETLEFH